MRTRILFPFLLGNFCKTLHGQVVFGPLTHFGKIMLVPLFLFLLSYSASFAVEQKKPSKEVRKELVRAVRLLQANHVEAGIEKLKSIVENHPSDSGAEMAQKLLRENWVGDEIEVRLIDRKTFYQRFQISEKSVLELGEKILKEIQDEYRSLKKPFFKNSRLKLIFYENQARYRKMGGKIPSAGTFECTSMDLEKRSFQGEIVWYFSHQTGSERNRQMFMESLLYHETAHYLNTIHFGNLPQLLDEGIAEYFSSRFCKESFQYYNSTERQRFEKDARFAINTIREYRNFVKMLNSP